VNRAIKNSASSDEAVISLRWTKPAQTRQIRKFREWERLMWKFHALPGAKPGEK